MTLISVPIITTSDCEGAGEVFSVNTPHLQQADFFDRPAFLTETMVIKAPLGPSGPFKIPGVDRRGVGNYEIQRVNFLQSQPKAREIIPFEKLQLLDIQ